MTAYTVTVEWGDCDPARIVFYPRYFAWFDAAARKLFADHGLPWEKLTVSFGSRGFPLVEAKASFRRPARFGDKLRIETHVLRWGAKSFVLAHRVHIGGELAVEGQETRVWGVSDPKDPEALRAGAIPDEVKRAIPAEAPG